MQISDQQTAANARIQRLFRALGASSIYLLCGYFYRRTHRHLKKPVKEPKKIVIQKGLWMACMANSIHVVPIAASMILVVLNWRGYYIGGELEGAVNQDDIKFLALQFTAKLHELTMNASLTAVIISYVRHELITNTRLPFGAIAAGLQFKDVSYLWSMEFWGVVRASYKRRNNAVLILLIFTCLGLAVSTGPSSATLMRPRLDYWPAGGTDFWIALPQGRLNSTNASATQVPANCMNDTGDLSCPSGGWGVIAQDYMSLYRSSEREGYMPDYVYVPGKKAVRGMRAFIRSTVLQFDDNNQTQATVGSSSVADGLVEAGRLWAWAAFWARSHPFHERFWSRIDVLYSVEAYQPIVHARCYDASNPASSSWVDTSASTVAVYDLSEDRLNNQGDFETLDYNYTNNEQVRSLVQNLFNSESVPQVAWATVPQSNGSALGATLNVPIGGNPTLFQCTIAARMAPGNLLNTRDNISIVTGSDHTSIYEQNNTFPPISIDPAWAAFLNPTISSNNLTAFQYMMQAAGILDDGSAVADGSIESVIESLLSLSVVNGLARRDFGVGFSGTLLGNTDGLDLISYRDQDAQEAATKAENFNCSAWCSHLLPSGYKMGYGGNAFNISNTESSASTKFTMRAYAQGYAYNSRGSAAKLAIIALLLYVGIALFHLMYTLLYSRETSSSWDSISELVALAMRSDRSEGLVNTGAGIKTVAIFEMPTKVIAKNGCLQLAVGDGVEQSESVKPDKEYG